MLKQRSEQPPAPSSTSLAPQSTRTTGMMQANFGHWHRHATDKGQVYLSNPQTGEVKWLWTRHHDRKTGRDYLVNAVTQERVWATSSNAHLCPITSARPHSLPAGTPSASAAPATARARDNPRYREVPPHRGAAQLGPDEVLLEDSTSGKRFISNRRTGASRWVAASASTGHAAPRPHAASRMSAPAAQRTMPANGAARKFAGVPKASPQAAALLLQRTYRGFTVRRVGVIKKLTALNKAVHEIEALCAPGTRYDLSELRRIANGGGANEDQRKTASERLLQLGEVLTQAMLKVDGVESMGFAIIRTRRKRSVKKLIELTEAVEDMRSKLKR